MSNNSQTPYQLLKSHFKIKSLENTYNNKFKVSKTKGIDRLSGIQFAKQAKQQIKIIHNKCLKGTYQFSPYLELLCSKGRGEVPRLLAIPTVRDRIVLHALKEILFQIFPECVPRKLANTYIHEIKKSTTPQPPSEFGFIQTNIKKFCFIQADIKNFYGSIDREKLFIKLKQKIKSRKILTLIKKAIETPTVPKNYHRKDIKKYIPQDEGIPQGLSISNILASIYLNNLDKDMQENSDVHAYYRYVDDILIFADDSKIDEVDKIFKHKIESLNLKFNFGKTDKGSADKELEYLGYCLKLPQVTVRASSIEKFLHSIAAKFSNYIHNRKRNLKKVKPFVSKTKPGENFSMDDRISEIKRIFIEELNEKITGAISENRRYGWIFYFNAITDKSILYKIDKIIAKFFCRLEDFDRVAPPNLKKISKAFHEAKYNPNGSYIHNYNDYNTVDKKAYFLWGRGLLDPEKKYSNEEIEELFEKYKRKKLSELERDDAILY